MAFDEVTSVNIKGMLEKFISESQLPQEQKNLWQTILTKTDPANLTPIALYFKESPEVLEPFSQIMMEKQALLEAGDIDAFIEAAKKDLTA